jgi:pyruvate dehydrogenase (quinone)
VGEDASRRATDDPAGRRSIERNHGEHLKRHVADDLLDVLVAAGVHRVYGLVGDSLNAFSDAVRRSGGAERGGIDWVHVHNEEAAAFAASAEAQLTGRLAICAGNCGPGNTHLIQGAMDAHRSGAPVLALASHIPNRQIGTGYFQETKPEMLFAEASRYCETVAHPDQPLPCKRCCRTWRSGKTARSSTRRCATTSEP